MNDSSYTKFQISFTRVFSFKRFILEINIENIDRSVLIPENKYIPFFGVFKNHTRTGFFLNLNNRFVFKFFIPKEIINDYFTIMVAKIIMFFVPKPDNQIILVQVHIDEFAGSKIVLLNLKFEIKMDEIILLFLFLLEIKLR